MVYVLEMRGDEHGNGDGLIPPEAGDLRIKN